MAYYSGPNVQRKSTGRRRDEMKRMTSAITTVNLGTVDLGHFRAALPGPGIIGRYDNSKVAAKIHPADLVFSLTDGSEGGETDCSSNACGFSNFAGFNTKGRTVDRMVRDVRFVGIAQVPSERDAEDGATGNVSCAVSGGLSFPNNGPDNVSIGTWLTYVIPPHDPKEKRKFDRDMRSGPSFAGRDTAIVRAYNPTNLIFLWKHSADLLVEQGQRLNVPEMVRRQINGTTSYGVGDTSAEYLATILKEFVSVCSFSGVVQACERGIVTPVTISRNSNEFAKLYRNDDARRSLLTASSEMATKNTSKTREVAKIEYSAATGFKAVSVPANERQNLKTSMTDFYRYLAASFNLISEVGAAPENFVLSTMVNRMAVGFASTKLANTDIAHKLFDAAFGEKIQTQFVPGVRPNNQLMLASNIQTTDDNIRRTIQSSFSRFMRGVGYTMNVERAQIFARSVSNTDAGNMLEAIVGGN